MRDEGASICPAFPSTIHRPSRRFARRTRSASFRSRAARRCSRCDGRGRRLRGPTIQIADHQARGRSRADCQPYIERHLRRLRGDSAYEIPYEHPTLEPVLKDTLGTIIFQDQVMEVAEAFAGFTPGEADGLRRAMSRKRSLEMLQRHRERFIGGNRRAAERDGRAGGRQSACGRRVLRALLDSAFHRSFLAPVQAY